MKAENYRQLLNLERTSLSSEDYDNTLMYFAELYHKEQVKNAGGMEHAIKILEVEKSFLDKILLEWNVEDYEEAKTIRKKRLKDLNQALKILKQ